MSDVTTKVSETVKKPISWARSNPWAMALVVLVVALLVLRSSTKMQMWLIKKVGDKTSGGWYSLAKWTGAIAAGFAIFFALDTLAGTGLAAAAGAGGVTMAVAAFPMPDFVAMKDQSDVFTRLITPGTTTKEAIFLLKSPRERLGDFPIKVTDVQFALKQVVTQSGNAGSRISWDKLAIQCAGLEIQSDRFGTMARKEDLTGPVLKHMSEFIARAYRYSGDELIADVASDAGTTTVTTFFTHRYVQDWAAKPDEFAFFVGWLQNTQYKFNLNTATAMAGISTGETIAGTDCELRCGFHYIVGAVGGNPANAWVVPPLVNDQVLLTPAAGQTDISFTGIGAGGQWNTVTANGERLAAAVYLSNVAGLPGPAACNDITEIGCEQLGLMPTVNVDMYLAGKLPRPGRAPAMAYTGSGVESYHRGWPWTVQHQEGAGDLLARNDLMGIPLVLPGDRTKISKLFRVKGGLTVHARRATPPSTAGTSHALYIKTLRDIDGAYAAKMLADAGVPATTTRNVSHDANAAVSSGQAKAASYTGIPQKPQT